MTSMDEELPAKDTGEKSRLSPRLVSFGRGERVHSLDAASFCRLAETAFGSFLDSFLVLLLGWIFSS